MRDSSNLSGHRGGPQEHGELTAGTIYGFRIAKVAKLALFHSLGHLPEPDSNHNFCWGVRKRDRTVNFG